MLAQNLSEWLNGRPVAQEVLKQLHEAWRGAVEDQQSVWAFAVELESLLDLGCTTTDLRRLVGAEVIEHAEEKTAGSARERSFRPEPAFVFGRRSCFVLTETGARVADALVTLRRDSTARPCWDTAARELLWLGRLVKRFRNDAANQECILTAFEELAWPARIDDPLPGEPGLNRKERLRQTVKSLNRGQKLRVLRFHADGTGTGLRWVAIG